MTVQSGIKITTSNKHTPDKITLHTIGGVGKTTFGIQAAKANNGVFICGEDGLSKLDTATISSKDINRFEGTINTWEDFQGKLKYLMTEDHPYKCVITDTIDSLMPSLETFVVNSFYNGETSKADAYGNKYNDFRREFDKVLKAYDVLIGRGIEVINLAHSIVTTHKDPLREGWNRWQFNLPEGTKISLVHQLYDWSDIVLYGCYDVSVDDKRHGTGRNRIAYTMWDSAYDAKSRYCLPEKITLDYNKLKQLIADIERKPQ